MTGQTSTGAEATLITWLTEFGKALAWGDVSGACGLFGSECYWRDLVAFSWNIRTFEGRTEIAAMLDAVLAGAAAPCNWRIDGPVRGDEDSLEAFLKFETRLGRGAGYVRLRRGKCWTLLTTLEELKGFEEAVGPRRPRGAPAAVAKGQPNWLEQRHRTARTLGVEEQPYVLIVGGGQAGLGLGARLKALRVPALIIDRQDEPGAQWRSRYRSLCLHDPVWYDHLPYLPFPSHWPIYTPKDKMAQWLRFYAAAMELDLWSSTECLEAAYVPAQSRWQVRVNRAGTQLILQPRQLVLALGASGKARIPEFRGSAGFKGPQLHSSQYRGDETFAGQRVTVIGSNNSAHDVCADLWERGLQPTMIQRSATIVVRSETLQEVALQPLYSEEAVQAGITTHRADLAIASVPLRVLPEIHRPLVQTIRERDAAFYARLRAAGFMLDFGADDSGLVLSYLRTASGYYIDVGASDMIADGRIALHSAAEVSHLEAAAVVLQNGTRVASDAVIYATGFNSMDEWARDLLTGTAWTGKCWGYGSGVRGDPGPWEGELRNMWKPTAQEGLWFHGGNLHLTRHYSLYLALQLKARYEGLPIHVYGEAGS